MKIKQQKRLLTLLATLLFATISYSQPQNVKFNKTIHDFGDIMLKSGHHKHTFVFENIGKQPVVVQTVIASCGCTTPVWTKQPIMPGEKGNIEVTFLNDQGPYPFDKALTVYITGEPKPVILRIRGVVHDKPKPLSDLFPENFNGLSFRKAYLNLGNIAMGAVVTENIAVANTTNGNITIEFLPQTKGLQIKAEPETLKPGQKGNLQITVDTKQSGNWGKTYFMTKILVNKKEVTNKTFPIYGSIRDNFSGMSQKDRENAPLPMAGSSSYDFGKVKAGEIVAFSFNLRNLGRSNLMIRKIESEHKKIKITYPGQIKPGGNTKVDVTLDTTGEFGEKSYILSIISNSPARPVMNFIISGNVTR
ncbi:MAG: DUF1573 domain-containing protein [Bacteroidia bacterium]|jgi:hypothetical protein|nr:DUF1573 domain-containing protein [Bacteroidales bacterium]MDD3299629.1 DUF1573 domain-containing protein [Bacteroidales bacterium]MDD3843239.1 DUF1573 domain-containing protein [Bacteroidales bacterium]NCC46514.1 DUF1573 domain-containing protein [Bacteroidia bacterium]